MALECTHIRFAVDVMAKFKVSDLDKYISGTVYPDSRYVTKTDRNLTHNEEFLGSNFIKDNDFRKGWVIHLLCDKVMNIIVKKTFPDLVGEKKGKIHQGNDLWIKMTALKILLDLNDFEKFDLQKYIDCLNYLETPNGEDRKVMKEYNQVFIDLYKGKEKILIADAASMWQKLGIGEDSALKAKNKAEEFSRDKNLMKKITGVYDEMVKYFLANFNSLEIK